MTSHGHAVVWVGSEPGSELKRALARAGIQLRERGALHVVAATSPRPPAGDPPAPWIWLARGAPAPGALGEAVQGAALDVIDGTRPAAEVAARIAARVSEAAVPLVPPPDDPGIVARSAAAKRFVRDLAHAAQSSMPVLLTGETGTGKEVFTRILHGWSARKKGPFVPINCSAIPNEMLEAELFGYARGAFSGAVRAYDGQLRAAEGGSVFLDEVDDTPASFQVKLLRVLEDRVVSRLGENTWEHVDFRILAATNRDLGALVRAGLFGADLYERLAIVPLRVPPLRERREDLPDLCLQLVQRFYEEEPAARERHQVEAVTDEALTVLLSHPWPGNVRELRNVLYAALIRKRAGHQLLVSDLPPTVFTPLPRAEDDASLFRRGELQRRVAAGRFNLKDALRDLESAALRAALDETHGNAAAAATLLGEVGRGEARDPGATVRAMMRRLGVAARR